MKKGWGRIGIMGENEGRVRQVEQRRAAFRSFFIPPKKPSPCFLTTPLKKENPFFRQLIKKNLVKKNYLVLKNYLVRKKNYRKRPCISCIRR